MVPPLAVLVASLLFALPDAIHAQSLRDFFSNSIERSSDPGRDELPNQFDITDDLSFSEVICKDKQLFPKKMYSKKYANFVECKYNLDRIQEASYLDLTYRIRWDNDRLDLYRSNSREIFICDGEEMNIYEHKEKKDPDWWMIVRNSLEYVSCENEIIIESLD
jgi:hypothetical protein